MTFRRTLAANRLSGQMSVFQKFEMGLKKFHYFEKKNYRDEKVIELPKTCKSTKIFFWP
jgi:hypothetical protein